MYKSNEKCERGEREREIFFSFLMKVDPVLARSFLFQFSQCKQSRRANYKFECLAYIEVIDDFSVIQNMVKGSDWEKIE